MGDKRTNEKHLRAVLPTLGRTAFVIFTPGGWMPNPKKLRKAGDVFLKLSVEHREVIDAAAGSLGISTTAFARLLLVPTARRIVEQRRAGSHEMLAI
jgi:hypothetical protein